MVLFEVEVNFVARNNKCIYTYQLQETINMCKHYLSCQLLRYIQIILIKNSIGICNLKLKNTSTTHWKFVSRHLFRQQILASKQVYLPTNMQYNLFDRNCECCVTFLPFHLLNPHHCKKNDFKSPYIILSIYLNVNIRHVY